jgi:hypothetical protein
MLQLNQRWKGEFDPLTQVNLHIKISILYKQYIKGLSGELLRFSKVLSIDRFSYKVNLYDFYKNFSLMPTPPSYESEKSDRKKRCFQVKEPLAFQII